MVLCIASPLVLLMCDIDGWNVFLTSSGDGAVSADSTSLWMTRAEKTGGRSADECLSAPSQGMLLEPRPSLSTDMDLTSSSTQRTSEATCSARTS